MSAYETVRRDDELLYVVTSADSLCDRLAKFYYWADQSALRTAVEIFKACSVDLSYVRKWSEEEGELLKFEEFTKSL